MAPVLFMPQQEFTFHVIVVNATIMAKPFQYVSPSHMQRCNYTHLNNYKRLNVYSCTMQLVHVKTAPLGQGTRKEDVCFRFHKISWDCQSRSKIDLTIFLTRSWTCPTTLTNSRICIIVASLINRCLEIAFSLRLLGSGRQHDKY